MCHRFDDPTGLGLRGWLCAACGVFVAPGCDDKDVLFCRDGFGTTYARPAIDALDWYA